MLVPDKFLLFRQLCYAKLAHMFSRSSVREPLSAKRLLISFSFFIIIIIIIFFLNIFFVDIIFPTIANCATEHFIMRLHVEQKRKKNGCGREWYPQRKSSFNGFVIGCRRFNDIFFEKCLWIPYSVVASPHDGFCLLCIKHCCRLPITDSDISMHAK